MPIIPQSTNTTSIHIPTAATIERMDMFSSSPGNFSPSTVGTESFSDMGGFVGWGFSFASLYGVGATVTMGVANWLRSMELTGVASIDWSLPLVVTMSLVAGLVGVAFAMELVVVVEEVVREGGTLEANSTTELVIMAERDVSTIVEL